ASPKSLESSPRARRREATYDTRPLYLPRDRASPRRLSRSRVERYRNRRSRAPSRSLRSLSQAISVRGGRPRRSTHQAAPRSDPRDARSEITQAAAVELTPRERLQRDRPPPA